MEIFSKCLLRNEIILVCEFSLYFFNLNPSVLYGLYNTSNCIEIDGTMIKSCDFDCDGFCIENFD